MKKAIKTSGLILLAALALTFVSSCGFAAVSTYDDAHRYQRGGADITGDVYALDISWISGEIFVEYYDGECVSIYEECDFELNEKTEMYHYLDGSTLRIQYGKSGARVNKLPDKTLTVLLPRGCELMDLEIESVSAEASVENIAVNSIDIETVSGDVDVTLGGLTDDVDISTVSGKVNVSCSLVGEASIETISGNVSLESLTKPTSVECDSTSADVSVTLPADTGFMMEYDTVSGNLNCEFETKRVSGNYVCGDGSTSIEMDTVSGNVNLRKGK